MLGEVPKGITIPNFENSKRLNLSNSKDISIRFCSYEDGLYLVEEVGIYKVYVQKPDSKKIKKELEGCSNQKDFTVWVRESNNNYWMPTHLYTLQAFQKLEKKEREIILKAIKSTVIDFVEPKESCEKFNCEGIIMGGYPSLLVLSYLKWLAVLEDILYPPDKYLGRKMAFIGYILIHTEIYKIEEIQRILKIWGKR